MTGRTKEAKRIIMDDSGLQPIIHNVTLISLQILEDRYVNASTLIRSYIPAGNRHEYFNEPIITDTILAHIISKAHRIELKGKGLKIKPIHVS